MNRPRPTSVAHRSARARIVAVATAVLTAATGLAACSSGSPTPTAPATTAATTGATSSTSASADAPSSAATTASAKAPSSAVSSAPSSAAGPSYAPTLPAPVRRSCPNNFDSVCLGRLQAGRTYTTQALVPTLTYTVPSAGWFNDEDEIGNFLLVAPKNTYQGVNAGTSDFIGVYTFVTGQKLIAYENCAVGDVPGTGTSPQTMVAFFRRERDLSVSPATPVHVGRLSGLVINIRVKPSVPHQYCVYDGERGIEAAPFGGVDPADFEHIAILGMTLRLYLLTFADPDYGHGVLCVELDDIDKAPGDLAQLIGVVKTFRFGR